MSITILSRSKLTADHKRMNIIIGVLIFGLFLFSTLGFAAGLALVGESDERERAATVIGNTAMCFNILYYFAPLSSALTVVRTMNSASLYAPLLALNLANALLWMCYGLAIGDVIVITPNVLGTIVSGGLLVLSFVIPKREKVPDEPKENAAFDEVSAPRPTLSLPQLRWSLIPKREICMQNYKCSDTSNIVQYILKTALDMKYG